MSTASSHSVALYLHVPFCIRRCRYCDFTTQAIPHGDLLIADYVTALSRLVERVGDAGLLEDVRTAYIGGGTPTMAGQDLVRLVETVVRTGNGSLIEISSEANPESLSPDLAADLAGAGLTRISLGVQSLDDRELGRLGRVHSAEDARAAMAAAVAAGLDLSCDLMCGIPLQTPESWEMSLTGVLEGGAGHVSCYPLALEDGTPLARAVDEGTEQAPDDDLQADLMVATEHILGEAGLERYEVASYARPHKACIHNTAYWTGVSYLGLGVGAASMLDRDGLTGLAAVVPLELYPEAGESWEGLPHDRLSVNADELLAARPEAARFRLFMRDDPAAFLRAEDEAAPHVVSFETLDVRQAAAEDLMLGMRMSRGVTPELLEHAVASGIDPTRLEHTLEQMQAEDLICRTEAGGYAPTERGWLFGNRLFGAMWDLHDTAE